MISDARLIDDGALLEHYARTRDAKAFGELSKRYAGLVYGTCLRVTQNPDDAEDVSQECFLELAHRAGTIHTSLAGWLHRVAKNRSINAIRRAGAQRTREHKAFIEDTGDAGSEWAEIAPYVDEALATLPERLRLPIILHYFQGLDQTQVAAEMGVSQPTVSRQLDKAVAALREQLRQAGFVAPVAVLGVLLMANGATAAPASLATALGKMALAGVGGASGIAGIPTYAHLAARQALNTLSGKVAVGALVAIIGLSLLYRTNASEPVRPPTPPPAPIANRAPVAAPVVAVNPAPAQKAEATVTPMETYRGDPFAPAGQAAPAVSQRARANAPITDLPIIPIRRVQPIHVATSQLQPPQPVRRMSGLVTGQGVYAIIESNGEKQVVQPGDTLNDRLAVVESIQPNRVILRTTGANPERIAVGLAPAPEQSKPSPPPSSSGPSFGIGVRSGAGMVPGVRMAPGVRMSRPAFVSASRRRN